MSENQSEQVSNYQKYLPIILQKDKFVGQFLLAFEQILRGSDTKLEEAQIITANREKLLGLEQVLDDIHLYFDPQTTPDTFLPWLAGWVALSLRDDWDVEAKKAFIQEIVKLYRLRGTKQGLKDILNLYLKSSGFGETAQVFDDFANFSPHYFQVQLTLNDRNPDKYWRQAKIAKAIIDQEKPAHTFYVLRILVLTMQITKRSLFSAKLFPSPENQILQLDTTALIETIELKAIVKITEPNSVTIDLLNKITVRFQDQVSDFHLLTPETSISIENSKIITKRRLSYPDFMVKIDQLLVIIKSLNEVEIQGAVNVEVSLEINQDLKTFQLLTENFTLPAVPPNNILQICRHKNEQGGVEQDKIPTIIGTTSQPLT